jgi:hypothetical protein
MTTESSEVPLRPITATKLIAVEGKDELNLLSSLKERLGIGNIEIRCLGGKYSLPTKLKSLIITPGFTSVVSLGVMRDANSNASTAFQSVCDALRNTNLPVPTQPLTPAKAHQANPQVVVLILPHGASEGMLEDICLQSVAEDPAMTCVERYFECLMRNIGRLPSNLSKAKVHAFLSSRNQPDLRLGDAAKAGYWPLTHQAFNQVKQFLSML